MKILITGGHLTPALAVIEKLKKEQVFYVGRKYSFEGDKAVSLEFTQISKLNIPFFEIRTARMQRKLTRFTLVSLLKLPGGFLKAYKIFKKTKPDIVLSFGSYVSVPVGIVANLLNIPLVIHEQTLEVGFANKILAPFADKICISFESSFKFFPKDKTILTGNPIRKDVLDLRTSRPEKDLLYVSGGSAGSHFINILLEENLENLLKKFSIIHQTGDAKKYNDFGRLLEKKNKLKEELSEKYTLVKFLDTAEAAKTISRSELLVGRSGINTVTELILLKKPAFLIPLMISQRDEQLNNAKFLKNLGLAEYYTQDTLTAEIFYKKLISMFENIDDYKLSENIVMDKAAENLVKVLYDVSKKKDA